jgi:subfamily B ATP-binding cassette protein MsbA
MTKGIVRSLPFFGLTWQRIFLLASLSLGAAIFEGFGMAMFLPVLEYVEKGQDASRLAATSDMWRNFLHLFVLSGIEVSLFTLLAAGVCAMLVRVAVIYARQVYSAWLGQEVQHTARTNLFDAYMGMDYGAFTRLSSGGLINTLTTEAQRAAGSFKALFALVANIMVAIGFVVVLLWLSVRLTVFTLILLATAGFIVSYYVRHTRGFSHAASGANERYSRIVLERLRAYRLTKLTAASARESVRTRQVSEEVRDLFFRLQQLNANVDLIMEPVAVICGGAIIYFAIGKFEMSLSEVGMFLVILMRLLPVAKEVLKSKQSYNGSIGSLTAVIESHLNANREREGAGGRKQFPSLTQSIRFVNVTFSYPDAHSPALVDVNFEMPAGRVTALVGPSGAGKTTLADLIPRLRVPQQGTILYDGIDGAEIDLVALRRGMAVVSQDAVVLDATVSENLRFACPEADDNALWQALSKAQAADFVRSLDHGLETRLGEHGIRLSGGQKQRISLARALLQDSKVLILDEPTSALDSETERDIQDTMDDLRKMGNVTVIVIAHRFSTVRNADHIVVLKDGRVAEQGSHDQLLVSEDWYARISGMQAGTAA